MSVTFLSEGDWEWGGSTAFVFTPAAPLLAADAGGWQWAGLTSSDFTPGPCCGEAICCTGVCMADAYNVHLHANSPGDCTFGDDIDFTVSRNDSDPDCPEASSCWVYSGAIGACITKFIVFCEAGGTWAWLAICPGCTGGDLEGTFSMVSCGPPLSLSGGRGESICGFEDCIFLVAVSAL